MTLSGDSLRLGTSEGRAVTTPVQHRSGSPATAARHGKQRGRSFEKRNETVFADGMHVWVEDPKEYKKETARMKRQEEQGHKMQVQYAKANRFHLYQQRTIGNET